MIQKRDLYIFLYKYRLRLLMAFALPFALFALISFIPTPRYKAESVLIVRLGSEYVYQPQVDTPAGSAPSAIPFDQDLIFKSEMAILSSADLQEKVIQSIGIGTLFPQLLDEPHGLDLLLKNLHDYFTPDTVSSGNDSDRVLLAQALKQFRKRFDLQLEKESAVIRVSFEHADHEMAAKVLNMLITDYMQKRKDLYVQSRKELAEGQVDMRRERVLATAAALDTFKQKNNLHSIEEERAELLRLKSKAEERSLVISSPKLRSEIAGYNRRLARLDELEHDWNVLNKELQIAENSYTLYSRKLDEASALEDLQRGELSSVRMIQPPTVPAEPQNLQLLILILGFFASLIMMLIVASFTAFMRQGFTTPEELEQELGVPVLAAIPSNRMMAA